MPVPDAVLRKLQRATVHLVALREAEDRFCDAVPYSIDHEVSDDHIRHTFRLRVHQPTPVELPLIAGDVLTNTRAALDYLVFGAAHRRGVATDDNASKWGFPIVDTEREFNSKRTALIRETLGEQFVDVLRSFQRFALGTGWQRDERVFLLYMLRDLCNIDKHRELSIFGFGWTSMRWKTSQDVTVRNEPAHTWPLKDGDRLTDLVLSSPISPTGVQLFVSWAPQLETRSKGDWWMGGRASDGLTRIIDYVVSVVVPRFDAVIPAE